MAGSVDKNQRMVFMFGFHFSLLAAGQALWVPGEPGGVVFIAWENTPRKLGFVYCLCRRWVCM